MKIFTATEAKAKLVNLMDDAAASHEPILIKGKRSNSVLISEDDWRSIQETLYLLGISGTKESIQKGIKTLLWECSTRRPF